MSAIFTSFEAVLERVHDHNSTRHLFSYSSATFRESARIYEIIASAISVAAVSVEFIKKAGLKTISSEPITIPPKTPA